MRRALIAASALALIFGSCDKSDKTVLAEGKPIGHWLESLHADDPAVRKKAVFKLGNVGGADPAVLATLIEELKDRDAIVRCEAILALVKSGAAAKEALPALAELRQSDPNAQVRAYAARAYEKLQRGS